MSFALTAPAASRHRGWFVFGGGISILVGACAIAAPNFFSLILTQLLGAFCLVSGLMGLILAVSGKDRPHRFFSGLSGVVRIAAGGALLICTDSGLMILTLVLAVVFLTEGIVCIVTALRMRDNPAWIWLLLNGVAALVLGGMIYARWPIDALWVVGLLFGIQSIFSGAAMLALALAGKKTA